MKKKVGLALAGGGVRGSYQIGAFYALKKCGIKFDAISGTSIGSFNAAMLASHKERKLLKFWQNLDVARILELDPILKEKELSLKKLGKVVKLTSEKLKNKGFNIQPIKDELNILLNEKKLRRSNINFGLVTLKSDDLKTVKIFIKDMDPNSLTDYVAASCYLPVFKKEKLVDDSYYLDGGFIDNCPIQMLEDIGCEKIYAIKLKAVGVFQKPKYKTTDITYIEPTKKLGSILSIDPVIINNNIKLGYLDTLKVMKKIDGVDYSFKFKNENYYSKLIKRVDKDLLSKSIKHYKTTNPKKLVLRVLEYILRTEKKDIYQIYRPRAIIKYIKKRKEIDKFQYEFIRDLR
ncbi:MAG TPA: patatin-like phospholipase family protein [Bacilli bacterium]|mgnify:CR=1 FL=1|nr:patatin-like phospholipase family protein [Bacilli bacterium]